MIKHKLIKYTPKPLRGLYMLGGWVYIALSRSLEWLSHYVMFLRFFPSPLTKLKVSKYDTIKAWQILQKMDRNYGTTIISIQFVFSYFFQTVTSNSTVTCNILLLNIHYRIFKFHIFFGRGESRYRGRQCYHRGHTGPCLYLQGSMVLSSWGTGS